MVILNLICNPGPDDKPIQNRLLEVDPEGGVLKVVNAVRSRESQRSCQMQPNSGPLGGFVGKRRACDPGVHVGKREAVKSGVVFPFVPLVTDIQLSVYFGAGIPGQADIDPMPVVVSVVGVGGTAPGRMGKVVCFPEMVPDKSPGFGQESILVSGTDFKIFMILRIVFIIVILLFIRDASSDHRTSAW